MPKLLPDFIRKWRYRIFYGLFTSRNYNLVTLGDVAYGLQWTICPDGLNSESIIYSGGVGEDISFEHQLIKRFGCEVYLLDPSPTGVETMKRSENKNAKLRFFQLALAARPGLLKMAPPVAGNFSWFADKNAAAGIEVPSTDLSTLMAKNGHDHIDLLKLDIEGCEYEVIDDILNRHIPVRQICADFDYGYVPGVTRGQAIRAMLKLHLRGYRLIKQDGANHTFILPRA
jgi:FkbM family methyltransferase